MMEMDEATGTDPRNTVVIPGLFETAEIGRKIENFLCIFYEHVCRLWLLDLTGESKSEIT